MPYTVRKILRVYKICHAHPLSTYFRVFLSNYFSWRTIFRTHLLSANNVLHPSIFLQIDMFRPTFSVSPRMSITPRRKNCRRTRMYFLKYTKIACYFAHTSLYVTNTLPHKRNSVQLHAPVYLSTWRSLHWGDFNQTEVPMSKASHFVQANAHRKQTSTMLVFTEPLK